MDMGGWAFMWPPFVFLFIFGNQRNKWLWISSVLIGIGGLFKEYAFLAFVVVFGLIIYINWGCWKDIIKKYFYRITGFYSNVYYKYIHFLNYNYTYLDWFAPNTNLYPELYRPFEYIKVLAPCIISAGFCLYPELIYFSRDQKKYSRTRIIFIWLVILSSLVVFVWPVVTRVLFITMPAVVLVSCLFINKLNRFWLVIFPIFVLYVLSSYLMDAYILGAVNIQNFYFFKIVYLNSFMCLAMKNAE